MTLVNALYPLMRPLLFKLPAEQAHHCTLTLLSLSHKLGLIKNCRSFEGLARQVAGLDFKNPIGVAAGLDKNADYIQPLLSLGFGFVEVGTVTPLPQPGNPKPRMFRYPEYKAVVNKMGFNNKGLEYMVKNLKAFWASKNRQSLGLVGVNIGKNKQTPLESADQDYLTCLESVYPFCDYVTINLSSPNTPGLRLLQGEALLTHLLSQLKAKQELLTEQHRSYRPLMVKISPDLSDRDIKMMVKTVLAVGVDGIIATNTTIDRNMLKQGLHDKGLEQEGGLSGAPLKSKANDVLQKVLAQVTEQSQGRNPIPVIGVGGIMKGPDAVEKLRLGANLIQTYTGLVFEGPALVQDIHHHLTQLAHKTIN